MFAEKYNCEYILCFNPAGRYPLPSELTVRGGPFNTRGGGGSMVFFLNQTCFSSQQKNSFFLPDQKQKKNPEMSHTNFFSRIINSCPTKVREKLMCLSIKAFDPPERGIFRSFFGSFRKIWNDLLAVNNLFFLHIN